MVSWLSFLAWPLANACDRNPLLFPFLFTRPPHAAKCPAVTALSQLFFVALQLHFLKNLDRLIDAGQGIEMVVLIRLAPLPKVTTSAAAAAAASAAPPLPSAAPPHGQCSMPRQGVAPGAPHRAELGWRALHRSCSDEPLTSHPAAGQGPTNYFLGTTTVTFRDFVVGSIIVNLPMSFIDVCIGASANSVKKDSPVSPSQC